MTNKVSLDWTNLNKSIVIEYTRKKYYNKFLYKLSYRVPGIRLISWNTRSPDIEQRIEAWNNRHDGINRPYSFLYGNDRANGSQIRSFYEVFQTKNENLKFRIEGNTFNLYSTDDDILYKIATNTLKEWKKSLISVSVVESDSARELLEKGLTIVKTKPDYAYRVKLREGFQKLNEKVGLATYLRNLGKDVRLSELMFDRLQANTKYFSGGYVYLNDPRLIDMLKLVAPNIIGPVDQMVNQ